MSNNDLIKGIEIAIDSHFRFLTAHGFGQFRVEQIGIEFYFINTNDRVRLDISVEDRLLAPIWVCIDRDYYVELMGLENPMFDELARQRKLLTAQWSNDIQHQKNYHRYDVLGQKLNDRYLQLAANTIQQNLQVLTGDYRY